ncbi:MAG: hypothetical protein Q8L48_13245 [Archangium sp.]|nr:hypothetical protein [Archangium sp.]
MRSLLKSFFAVSFFVSSLALAQPEGEIIIRTRDGKTRQGRVLSETQKGYLFASQRGTSVIEFTNIVDLQKVEVVAEQPVAVTPPVAVAVAPAPVVVAPAPIGTVAPPPPPPERPIEVVSDDAPAGEKGVREGFHFGIGANLGVNNGGPSAQVQAHFEFNFGRPVYRITANLGGLSMYSDGFFNGSIDNLFQYNIGDVYAFGAGVQVGVALGFGGFVYVAPVLQPVIIKLGDRGQHQLALTGSVAVLSNWSSTGRFEVSWAGTVQVFAGYSYLF